MEHRRRHLIVRRPALHHLAVELGHELHQQLATLGLLGRRRRHPSAFVEAKLELIDEVDQPAVGAHAGAEHVLELAVGNRLAA